MNLLTIWILLPARLRELEQQNEALSYIAEVATQRKRQTFADIFSVIDVYV